VRAISRSRFVVESLIADFATIGEENGLRLTDILSDFIDLNEPDYDDSRVAATPADKEAAEAEDKDKDETPEPTGPTLEACRGVIKEKWLSA